jgi:hypothetical protein
MCRVGGLWARFVSADGHVAFSSRLKSAPTHANRFGEGFIFVEIRFEYAGFGGSCRQAFQSGAVVMRGDWQAESTVRRFGLRLFGDDCDCDIRLD